jgi:proline iminopeptidase
VRSSRWEQDDYRHVFATLITHYWTNDAFLAPPILERMDVSAAFRAR